MAYGIGFVYGIGAQILFFIVTIVLIVWFVKNSNKKVNNAKDILDNRLASGEIEKKQYVSLLKTINYSEEKK